MRNLHRSLIALPVAALVAACSGGSAPDSALSADLQRDLDLAKSTSVELASANRNSSAVVSAMESAPAGRVNSGDRAEKATPRRHSAPRPTAVAQPTSDAGDAPVASEAADVAATSGEVEATTVADAAVPTEAPVQAPDPVVIAGPQVTPEGVGTGRPRDPGGWGTVGTGVGVVLRGGGVGDDDHCEIIRPGRGGIFGGARYPTSGRGGRLPGGIQLPSPSGGTPRTRGGSTVRSRGTIGEIGGIIGAASAAGRSTIGTVTGGTSSGSSRRRP